jgi:hypothetical protein
LKKKLTSSSSGTKKMMVIVNPSAFDKNGLGPDKFKKGVVIVSPRLVSDGDGHSNPASPSMINYDDEAPIKLDHPKLRKKKPQETYDTPECKKENSKPSSIFGDQGQNTISHG